MKNNIQFAFFGTSHIAAYVLDALHDAGLTPACIVTTPDKPQGRGLELVASAVKKWAEDHSIECLQPEKIDGDFIERMKTSSWDVCIVVDYGTILPQQLLDIPVHGFLNVHPSLLPRLRGPSPLRTAILTDEKNTGVTIMLVDEKMDHGPIVAQKAVMIPKWPPHLADLERELVIAGGQLLAQILPHFVAGEIEAREQNHDVATYSAKISKEDGLLDLNDDPYTNLLKIRAYEGWPGTYTYFERTGKKIRVSIIDAHIENKKLLIDTVKPEGKKEMKYEEFARSGAVIAK